MNKIIQIRGSNAVGKTTCIRSFILKNGLQIENILVGNIKTDITTDKHHKIIILGRYDVLNGGCDRYKNKYHIIDTILFLIKEYKPFYIIFEGFIYGKTFKFAMDLYKIAKLFNYEYVPIVLFRNPEKALELLYARNGEAKINEKTFYDCYKSSLSSYRKIKDSGINIKLFNTDNILEDEMYKIIEKEIRS